MASDPFFLLALLLLSTSCPPASPTFLSSSSLEACTNDGTGLTCTRKLVVVLAVDGGSDAEAINFTITNITDTSEGEGAGQKTLTQPLTVTLSKSRPLINYPVVYLQAVNNRPYEAVLYKDLIFDPCVAGLGATQPTCGWAYTSTGQQIPYSDGFCCDCDWAAFLSSDDSGTRSNLVCSLFGMQSSSASCLRFDPLWYSVFSVESGIVSFKISVKVTANNSSEVLVVSPELPKAKSPSAGVSVQLQGDIVSYTQTPDFSSKYLLVPSIPSSHPRVMAGVANWMFVDLNLVDLSGATCNKIGVSYEAFYSQGNACQMYEGSCLANQIDGLYASDDAKRQKGIKGQYFISNYGLFSLNSSLMLLTMNVPGSPTSLVTISVSADSMTFITNVASGIIASVTPPHFLSLSSSSTMIVYVQNTGQIDAQFTVTVGDCSPLVKAGQAQTSVIPKGVTSNYTFQIIYTSTYASELYCNVTLLDSLGVTLDQKVVVFNSTSVPNQTLTNPPSYTPSPSAGQGGSSWCDLCGWNILCLMQNGCWGAFFKTLFIFAVLVLVVVVLLKCLRVLYPILDLAMKCFFYSIRGCMKLILCCCRDDRDSQERVIEHQDTSRERGEWWEKIVSGYRVERERGLEREREREGDVVWCDAVRAMAVSYFNVQCKSVAFSFAGVVVKESDSPLLYSFIIPPQYQAQVVYFDVSSQTFQPIPSHKDVRIPSVLWITSHMSSADVVMHVSAVPQATCINKRG